MELVGGQFTPLPTSAGLIITTNEKILEYLPPLSQPTHSTKNRKTT